MELSSHIHSILLILSLLTYSWGHAHQGAIRDSVDEAALSRLIGNIIATDIATNPSTDAEIDSFALKIAQLGHALRPDSLYEHDYNLAAEQLGVDIATIKAVVKVETGNLSKGFAPDGSPIINFDQKVFQLLLRKNKISASQHSNSEAFGPLNLKTHKSINAAHWARLNAARLIDTTLANKSTFWGMFQIAGFNWNKCGVENIDEFIRLASQSEHAQLQLFVNFIKNDKRMVEALRQKQWARFARLYNGPKYARRGYHTKLAKSYKDFAKAYE